MKLRIYGWSIVCTYLHDLSLTYRACQWNDLHDSDQIHEERGTVLGIDRNHQEMNQTWSTIGHLCYEGNPFDEF